MLRTRRSGVRVPPGAPFFSCSINHLAHHCHFHNLTVFTDITDNWLRNECRNLESESDLRRQSLGITETEFGRMRTRLSQLSKCFLNGEPVPRQRKPYKKRVVKTMEVPAGIAVCAAYIITREHLDKFMDDLAKAAVERAKQRRSP
jgi:hypothetical protein